MNKPVGHTPGGWYCGYSGASGYCIYGDNRHIATVHLYKSEGGATTAARIVHCVNNFDALVDALNKVHAFLDRPAAISEREVHLPFGSHLEAFTALRETREAVSEALAAATGEKA